MQNPRLATRYAKSLLDLAVEKNCLEATLKDMQALNDICHLSHDFTVMLRSPVISGDKKLAIMTEVMKNYSISELTHAFIDLLVHKGRELNLPEIAEAFMAQYNELRNIRTVKLTTAVPVDAKIRDGIMTKISGFMPGNTIELHAEVNAELIGGFVLEVEDKLYDASVKKSLSDFRASITDTTYTNKM